jgi:hypothetical protein
MEPTSRGVGTHRARTAQGGDSPTIPTTTQLPVSAPCKWRRRSLFYFPAASC